MLVNAKEPWFAAHESRYTLALSQLLLLETSGLRFQKYSMIDTKVNWLQPASLYCARPLVPPLQHAQRAERIPAAGGADAFELEPSLALVAVVERPAAVLALCAADNVDCFAEALVARRARGLEIVERAEDVVVPARWEGELKENRLDDFARAMRAKQPVHQQKLAAAGLGGPYGAHFAPPVQLIQPQAFEDTDGGVH
jgi:hypothetical protein